MLVINNSISIKVYIKNLFMLLCIFLSYHLIIWTLFTSQIFGLETNTSVGDLGRLSYQVNLLHKRKAVNSLAKPHLHSANFNNQQIDIITIGDSFSNGGGGGPNPYYQDHLATTLNKNILNLKQFRSKTALDIVIELYNSGNLKKMKPEAIIVECVERFIPGRYNKNLDFSITSDKTVVATKHLKNKVPHTAIINNANYKLPYYMLKYNYNNNAQSLVYRFKLNKKLFSIEKGKNILILNEDIKNINQFTKKSINKVNENFNKVAKMLKTLNIKLYFMPAVDKYDLYYDYISENKYPKNPFFELIRPLKKDYYFVDTKKILSPLLEKGVEDIFWIDDTHWTHNASNAIAHSEIFNK